MGTSCWKQQLRYDPFGVRIPAIGSHSWDEAKLLELNCTEHKSLAQTRAFNFHWPFWFRCHRKAVLDPKYRHL